MNSIHKVTATNAVDMLRCLAEVYRTEQKVEGVQTVAEFLASADDDSSFVNYLTIARTDVPAFLVAVFTVHTIIGKLLTSREQVKKAEIFLVGTLPEVDRFVSRLIRSAATLSSIPDGDLLLPILSDALFASHLEDMAILLSFLDGKNAPIKAMRENSRGKFV